MPRLREECCRLAGHGGDIEICMRFLDSGLALVRTGLVLRAAADEIVKRGLDRGETLPGSDTAFIRVTRGPQGCFKWPWNSSSKAITFAWLAPSNGRSTHPDSREHPLPINVDGAIAAIAGDLGLRRRSPTRCSSSRVSLDSSLTPTKKPGVRNRCVRSIRKIINTMVRGDGDFRKRREVRRGLGG